MAEQKLTPKAAAAKAKRDLAYAKTPFRRKRKAENQRLGQSPFSDIHHKSDGTTERVSIKKNRGNFGKGTKTENMSTAFKLKYSNGKKADPSVFPFKIEGGVDSESPNKFLRDLSFDKKAGGEGAAKGAAAGMAAGPWGAVIGGLAGAALGGLSKKQVSQEDFDKQISRDAKRAQNRDIKRANDEKLKQEQEQDVSNAEDMAEPKAPKTKTQELDKAIKEVKKQKPKSMTESQAYEQQILQN